MCLNKRALVVVILTGGLICLQFLVPPLNIQRQAFAETVLKALSVETPVLIYTQSAAEKRSDAVKEDEKEAVKENKKVPVEKDKKVPQNKEEGDDDDDGWDA
ncbi:MAG: hypothetical protein P1P89_11065 [Desulfobacterales bacterium]|nr:hypothetical protein [Desulfobacterales bacterium]